MKIERSINIKGVEVNDSISILGILILMETIMPSKIESEIRKGNTSGILDCGDFRIHWEEELLSTIDQLN